MTLWRYEFVATPHYASLHMISNYGFAILAEIIFSVIFSNKDHMP